MGDKDFNAPEDAYAMAYNDGHRDGRNKTGYDPTVVKLDRQTFRDAYQLRAESFESVTDEWIINRKRSNPLSRHYVPEKSAESFAAQRKPPWSAANPKPNRIIECGECDARGFIHGRECSECDGAGFWKIMSPKCALCGDWIAGTDGAECDECDKWYCDAHYDIDNNSCVVCGDPMTDSESMVKHSEDYANELAIIGEKCDNERSFLISILSDRQLDEFLEFEEDSYSAEDECDECGEMHDDTAGCSWTKCLDCGTEIGEKRPGCQAHYEICSVCCNCCCNVCGDYLPSTPGANQFNSCMCGHQAAETFEADTLEDCEERESGWMQTTEELDDYLTWFVDNSSKSKIKAFNKYRGWSAEDGELPPVTCKICGKTFDTFRGLNGHMNAHLPAHRKRAETKLGKDSCCCGATKTNPCACMIQGVMNCNATCPCSLEKKNAESADEVCWKCIHSSTPHPPGSARECNVCHTHKPATAFTREDAREVVEQYSSGYEHYCDACDIEMESWEDLKAGGHDLELLGPDAPRYGRWYGKREYKCKICEETYRSRHFDPSEDHTWDHISSCPGSPIPDHGQCPECKAQIDHLVESMNYSCPECGEELEESDSHWEHRPWDEFGKTLDPRYQAESFDSEWNCVICGHKSTGYGNNPEPVASAQSGRCCDTCNTTVVIPTRLRDSFRAEEGCSCPVCGTQTEVIREYFDDDTSWVDLVVCDNCYWMEELDGNEDEYEEYMEEMLALQDEEPDADLLEKPNVVVDTSWDWSDGVGPPPSQQTLDLEFDAEGEEIYWNASCKPCYWENRFISTDKGQLPDHCPQCNKAVTLVAVDVENNLLAAEGDEELTDEEKQEGWNQFQEEAASIEDPDLEQIKTLADKYLLDVIDDETPEFFVDPGLEDYYQFILTDPTYPEGGEPEDEEAAAMFEELKHVRYWATILTDQHLEQADTAAKAMMAAGIMGDDKELFDKGMLGLETNNQVQRERELIAQWLAEGGVHEN